MDRGYDVSYNSAKDRIDPETYFVSTPDGKRRLLSLPGEQTSRKTSKQGDNTDRYPIEVWRALLPQDRKAIVESKKSTSTPSGSSTCSSTNSRAKKRFPQEVWDSMTPEQREPYLKCPLCRKIGHYKANYPVRAKRRINFTDSLADPESDEAQDETDEVERFHLNISETQVEDSRRFTNTTGNIDCCATTAIVANAELLTDVRPRKKKMIIHGVNSAGEPLVVIHEGDMGVSKSIPYHQEARVNILSHNSWWIEATTFRTTR